MSIIVPFFAALAGRTAESAAPVLAQQPVSANVDYVCWPELYDYAPFTQVRMAHDGEFLFVRFDVSGKGLRAVHTKDLEFVHEDACVEFFVGNADATHYWNLEFNCIGVCNASYRAGRKEDVHRLSPEQLGSIQRFASLGTQPFEATDEDKVWSLTLRIPLALIEISEQDIRKGVERKCNLYKCGDKTVIPHFVSCYPVKTEHPDFHRPEYFGSIRFESTTGK